MPSVLRSVLPIVLCLAVARIAAADVLVEYLFWDQMGKQTGNAVKNLQDYREQRELWSSKIAENESKLERCGDCPQRAEIVQELKYWKDTENQFQQFAGNAFASVGMPPEVAEWLGIDMPLAPRNSKLWEEQNRIVRKPWVDERPEFCQIAVDEHLQCLRDFQQRSGTSWTEVAKRPGGDCYDTRKLYLHCANENYQAFEMEKNLQAARLAGEIIPEFVGTEEWQEVYYGPVPDDFLPTLPPEVVQGDIREIAEVRLTTRKKGTGVVGTVIFERFFWVNIVPTSDCFSRQEPHDELARRVCEDLSDLSWHVQPPATVLACRYTEPGGALSVAHTSPRFWYGSRPELADPERLLERNAEHPVLKIGEPRTDCPLTRQVADAAHAEWQAQLATLRAATEQVAATVVIPESDQRLERQAQSQARYERAEAKKDLTSTFSLKGRFEFETIIDGSSVTGNCVSTWESPADTGYLLTCRHAAGRFVERIDRPYSGSYQVKWPLRPPRPLRVSYQVDESDPETLIGKSQDGSAEGRLVRKADLVPLADFPLFGRYDFERSIGAENETGQCTIGPYPRIQGQYMFSCVTPDGEAFEQSANYREDAIYVTWAPLGGRYMNGVAFTIDRNYDPAQPETHVLVGSNREGGYVRMVRTGDLSAADADGDGPIRFTPPDEAPTRDVGTPASSVAGAWSGHYECSRQPTGLELTITEEAGARVSAEFAFFGLPDHPGVPSGRYMMSGTVDAGRLRLLPGKWLQRPPGFTAVGLVGALEAGGNRLRGQIQHPSCGAFELTRNE